MKMLYASCRYDPLDPDAGSGVDFNLVETFKRSGVELQTIGPFKDRPSTLEKIYRKGHRLFSRRNTAKFSEAYLHSSATAVEKAIADYKPDILFSDNLIPLVYLRTVTPIIYKSNSFLINTQEQWPTYSKLEFIRMLKWEKAALQKSALIITTSSWAEESLTKYYHVTRIPILVISNPSSLSLANIPPKIDSKSDLTKELHLLAVGKDFDRKGIDIAIEVQKILQAKRINSRLRIVGIERESTQAIQFMGLYKKKNPDELSKYIAQYQWADLLLHPARYDASPIVCSEAAAFGVPTITNASGGMATSVQDGVSGIVLPKGSPAEMYVRAIEKFIANRNYYEQMRKTTRQRYEKELTWPAAGKIMLGEIQRILHG